MPPHCWQSWNVAVFDVTAAQLAEIESILQSWVPEYTVVAFGSRVTGGARSYSDLDLAVVTEDPLPLQVMANLDDAFAESNLPMRVDISDWSRVTPAFRDVIGRQYSLIQ